MYLKSLVTTEFVEEDDEEFNDDEEDAGESFEVETNVVDELISSN